MKAINPYTGELIKEYKEHSFEDALQAIQHARKAQASWSHLEISARAAYLRKVAETLRRNKQRYAELMTCEMGKIIRESQAEVEKCALCCDFYADHAEDFLAPEIVKTETHKSQILFQPLGIVFAIMPWNFPFWQVFRCAAPALMAGNVVIVKHASNVPGCALAIEESFREAGLPEGAFRTLLISSDIAMKLVEHVDAVSLTGSNKAGESIGELAGKHIKPCVLELGGSDPFIVLENADVEKAAQTAARARFLNCGQSCIAAKRFIVHEKVAKVFEDEFVRQVKRFKIGNPMDPSTDIAPIARQEFIPGLKTQLDDAKQKGAKVLFEATVPSKGFFFPPAILSNVNKGMKVLKEEIFGPIAPIITVKSDEEAIQMANDSIYGLAASLWCRDLSYAEKLAARIQAGTVTINDFVKSDPRMPFGGIKKSGMGRELSRYGMLEFVNIKTINMQP